MKIRPLLWVLVLIGFLVPVVLAIIPKPDARPPSVRYPFLKLATLEKAYAPHYTNSLKFQRGNSYLYRSNLALEKVEKEVERSSGWKRIGRARNGATVYRHSSGTRLYVSNLESAEYPEARTYIVLIDSVRRVGWVEREVARAWFRMQADTK